MALETRVSCIAASKESKWDWISAISKLYDAYRNNMLSLERYCKDGDFRTYFRFYGTCSDYAKLQTDINRISADGKVIVICEWDDDKDMYLAVFHEGKTFMNEKGEEYLKERCAA